MGSSLFGVDFQSIYHAICRMGIFMICAQAIVHFRPKENYEKYLKLLVSVMVLIQLFVPLGGFLLGKGGQEAAEALEEFREELEQGMRDAEEKAAVADRILEKMTLEELRSLMEAEMAEEGRQGEPGGEPVQGSGRIPEESGEGEESVPDELGSAKEGSGKGEDGSGVIQVGVKAVEPIEIGTEGH